MKWFSKYSLFCLFVFALVTGTSTLLKALGCATDLKSTSKTLKETAWTKYWNAHRFSKKQNSKAMRTPSSDLTSWSKDRPWGGLNTANWKPEAIVANAASDALARGFAEQNAQEVLVSIPVKMLYGHTRPYGDGQTNAAVTLGSFNGKIPPIIASWISFSDGSHTLTIRISQVEGFTSNGQVKLNFGNAQNPINLGSAHSIQGGVFELSWKTPSVQWGDLYQNHVAYLQLPGRSDWFPLDFRDSVKPVSELLNQIPENNRNLAKGTFLDPEAVSSQPNNSSSPFVKMYPGSPNPDCASGCVAGPNDFGGNLQAVRYSPVVGVHNQFINTNGSTEITSVGNGDTTVIPQTADRFKMAYICFNGRNLSAENQFGVPSGGGWHEIGDPAETVMNTLENASPLFGYANGKPGDDRPYAYGLSDVTIIRKLRPGTALVTASGATTTREGYTSSRGEGIASGRNYHWFAFEEPEEVCAMEWVHNCVPSPTNHIGLVCSSQ